MRQGQTGLTLLEMMLGIILAAVMSVYFINFVKQRATSEEVLQTAAQMRNLLLASQQYYLDNNRNFPSTIDDLHSTGSTRSSYVTDQDKCSPWITSTKTSCGKKQEYVLNSGTCGSQLYTSVSIQVDSGKIADEIVKILPNSTNEKINKHTYQVTASVNAPDVHFRYRAGLIIKKLEYKAVKGYSNASLNKPACPSGFEPAYEVAMTSFPFYQPDIGGDIDACLPGAHGARVAPGPNNPGDDWYNVGDQYDWHPYLHRCHLLLQAFSRKDQWKKYPL